VSRSGFYKWLNRQPSRRAREDQQLLTLIRTSFTQSDATYGSPRVWDDLTEWGERCSRKRVARLMRSSGLRARARRLRPPTDSGMRPEHCIAPNVLDRQFEAAGPSRSGSPTSPTSAPAKAGCIWRSSWISSAVVQWVGR